MLGAVGISSWRCLNSPYFLVLRHLRTDSAARVQEPVVAHLRIESVQCKLLLCVGTSCEGFRF